MSGIHLIQIPVMRSVIIFSIYFLLNNFVGFAQTNKLIPYLKGKRWGYVNTQQEIIIPCMYDYAYPFSEGVALVELQQKFGYINTKGQVVVPIEYAKAYPFKNGRAKVEVRLGKKTDHQFMVGYINTTGKPLIPIQYLGITSFHDQLAMIWNGEKNGFINESGKTVLASQYKYATNFREKRTWIASKPPQYDPLVGMPIFEKASLIGPSGKVYTTITQAGAETFSEGKCLVTAKLNDSTLSRYFIDLNGKKTLDVSAYDAVHGFTEGRAAVMKNGKLGFIDTLGKLVIPCKYTINFQWFRQDHKRRLFRFINGLTAVMISPQKGWTLIDTQGNTRLAKTYQYLQVITRDQVIAKLHSKKGIIHPNGKVLLPFIYYNVRPFKDGLALVRKHKGQYWFYVDQEGNEYYEE